MSVPGIMNPFTRPPYPLSGATDSRRITNGLPEKRLLSLTDRPHPSSLPPPVPLARKRGWQPSSPEPSPAAAVTTSTRGHLNVRPGYHDTTDTPEAQEEDQGSEMMADELPPAKRRRTLAKTIVYGAVNAALIGTAVGLTVYRLWKDRGKVPELEPPPYEQGGWVPNRPEEAGPSAALPAPKKSHSAPNTLRRGTQRHRRVRTLAKIPMTPPRLSRQPSPQRPTKVGSDLDQGDELEDRMDWIGGRLSQLIEDGKKALGKEIVVMSEVQEDEEDDGNGSWEEEADPDASIAGPSQSGSVRRRGRLQSAGTASSLSPPPTASPRRQKFSAAHLTDSCSPIPARASHDPSADATRLCASFREDEDDWRSSELRKSMERARAAYLRSRP